MLANPEIEALEIATKIVIAKASSSSNCLDKVNGEHAAQYFKALYEGIKEITCSIKR